MGWQIGLPSLKLNNTGAKSKHCGSFARVVAEALEERQGRDPDIDHEKSEENIYSGFRSAAELQEYSRKHVDELSSKQIAAGGRKIRSDAVVMCATIIKPPAAMMNELSREDQIRFCNDALEKFGDIVGKDNIKSTVIHFDELGTHVHTFWEPITADGRLCAKEMHNLQFFSELNREMPEHLRSRGWDIADCKAYDQAEEKAKTEKEKAEERAKKGRPSGAYKADVEREKAKLMQEIDRLADAKKGPIGRTGPLSAKIENLENRMQDLETANERALRKNNILQEENDKLRRSKTLSTNRLIELENKVEKIEKENSRLKAGIKRVMDFLREKAPWAAKIAEKILRQEDISKDRSEAKNLPSERSEDSER